MIYLDYSATCPIDEEVLDSFVKSAKYIGNPNSLHKLGAEAKELIDASTKQIKDLLDLKDKEVIYTSGASEANNLAIKGVENYFNRGNHIITTDLEHSSVYGPLNYLTEKNIEVSFVPLKNGLVDLEALEKLITDKTVLVSIGAVNSETGIRQPIEKIGKLLKKYPKVLFHSDVTQAIGKIKIDLTDVDMASFSAQKFFGIKGVGALVKNNNIRLTPLIHGGKSTTVYRSGTPATQLIVSMAKALRLAYKNIDSDLFYVKKLNSIVREKLKKYPNVYINSTSNSIDHILNISITPVKAETFMHALEMEEVYVSTQSACSVGNTSKAVMSITNDVKRASSSIRISISRKTTEKEIGLFLKAFDKCYNDLVR